MRQLAVREGRSMNRTKYQSEPMASHPIRGTKHNRVGKTRLGFKSSYILVVPCLARATLEVANEAVSRLFETTQCRLEEAFDIA